MKLTFIVSCFERPAALRCCLACLANQTYQDIEIIVTDNSFNPEMNKLCAAICQMDPRIRYRLTRALGCDYAAEEAVPEAQGEFVGFPSDDSIYSPYYAAKLMGLAIEQDLELVYSNIIMDAPVNCGILDVYPACCHIDKTCFILKKDRFIPFPGKNPTGSCSDGNLIDELMRQGIRHGKIHSPLCFHI